MMLKGHFLQTGGLYMLVVFRTGSTVVTSLLHDASLFMHSNICYGFNKTLTLCIALTVVSCYGIRKKYHTIQTIEIYSRG